MRIGIATVQSPFIRGGAESHIENLAGAFRRAGHEVEVIAMPFRFNPPSEVERSMEVWEGEDFSNLNGYEMDVVVCMKFPCYYLKHPHKVAWLLHQHRAVYELWETPFSGDLPRTPEGRRLRRKIIEKDTEHLRECVKVYTNSKRVSDRLAHYNGLGSSPLYHPPSLADKLYTARPEPYIFFPSRLEELKRQSLLIEAMRHVKTPIVALIGGEGGQRRRLEAMIEEYRLGHKVRLMGRLEEEEILAFYAHCLGVFFGPFDEDLGYITLEAMITSKPVVTCTDSGGPVEFVRHGETGYVVEPQPERIAAALDELYLDQGRAIAMGRAGRELFQSKGITWPNVVRSILRHARTLAAEGASR